MQICTNVSFTILIVFVYIIYFVRQLFPFNIQNLKKDTNLFVHCVIIWICSKPVMTCQLYLVDHHIKWLGRVLHDIRMHIVSMYSKIFLFVLFFCTKYSFNASFMNNQRFLYYHGGENMPLKRRCSWIMTCVENDVVPLWLCVV